MPGMAVTVGNLNVKLSADGSGFQRAMGGARQTVGRFGGNVATAGVKVAKLTSLIGGLAAAGVALAAGGSLKGIAESQLASLDATAKFADRLGLAAERLAGLRHAAEQTGVSAGKLDTGLQRMTRRLAEAGAGTGAARAALAELGLDAGRLAAMSPDEQFHAIADAMQGVANQGDRVRLAMRLFDSEGVGLVNTLKVGSDGLREYQREAERLGIAMTGVQLDGVEDANDAIDRMRKSFSGATGVLVSELSPSLVSAANVVTDFLTEGDRMQEWAAATAEHITYFAGEAIDAGRSVGEFVAENRELIVTGGKVVAVTVAANQVLPAVTAGITGAATAMKGFRVASLWLAANPIGLALLGAAAAGTTLYMAMDRAGPQLAAMADRTREVTDAADAMRAADLRRIDTLAKMERRGSMTSQQQAEAARIVAELEGWYGDLGIELGRTEGWLDRVTAAQRRLNEVMREQAVTDVRNEIGELNAAIAALEESAAGAINPFDLDQGHDSAAAMFNAAYHDTMNSMAGYDSGVDWAAAAGSSERELLEVEELVARRADPMGRLRNLTREASVETDALTGKSAAAFDAGRVRTFTNGVEAATLGMHRLADVAAQPGDELMRGLDRLQREVQRAGRSAGEIRLMDLADLDATVEQLDWAAASLEEIDRRRELSVKVGVDVSGVRGLPDATSEAFSRVRDEIDALTRDPIEFEVRQLDISGLRPEAGQAALDAYGALLREREDLRGVSGILRPDLSQADVAGGQLDALERLLSSGRIDGSQFGAAVERLEASLADGPFNVGVAPAGPSSREAGAIGSRGQDAAALAQQQIRLARGAVPVATTPDERQLAEAKAIKRSLDRIEKLQAQLLAVTRGEGREEVRV